MNIKKKEQGAAAKKGGVMPVLIGLLAVLLALGGGFFAYSSHQRTMEEVNDVLEAMFAPSFTVSLYEGEQADDWAERFNAVQGKGAFRKALSAAFRSIADAGLKNQEAYVLGGSKDWDPVAKDSFGQEQRCDSCAFDFIQAVGYLAQKGYEDAAVTEAVQDFFTREKQLNLDTAGAYGAGDAGKTAERIASTFNSSAQRIEEWNEAGGGFYRIDRNSLYPEEELRARYDEALRIYRDSRDLNGFTRTLYAAMTSPVTGEEPFLSAQEIFDFYVEGSDEIYTTLQAQGGYYDYAANLPGRVDDDPGSCYGDFYYSVSSHKRGGQTFDMTEFENSPGLWDSIGGDLQRYITSTNREANRTVHSVISLFQGENMKRSAHIADLAKDGFHYAVPLSQFEDGEGRFIFVSKDGISLERTDEHVIPGDFSAIYDRLKAEYKSRSSALKPYADYTGVFTSKSDPAWTFRSDFFTAGGAVQWVPSAAPGSKYLPFAVVEDGKEYEYLNGPRAVNGMQVTEAFTTDGGVQYQAVLQFRDGAIQFRLTAAWPDGGEDSFTDTYAKTS